MMARKCYATALLEKVPKETLTIENLEALFARDSQLKN
jgi:hypothetical protein